MKKDSTVYLTPEGIEELKEELDELVNVRRPALAERLRKAIRQGDLSENADYIMAKEDQAFLEGRIREVKALLSNAVVIEESDPTGEVKLGSRVTVVQGDFDPETYHLVGPTESDPGNGKISYESPLGEALLGNRVGDTVRVEAPAGEIKFEIVNIE